jgi:hypothetical protein
MRKSILRIFIALACVPICGRTMAGNLSVETKQNDLGMVESTVVVPGDGMLKETRFTFNGVIQNFLLNNKYTQLVTNADESIIGVNVRQATKQNAVYFILRDRQKGTQLLTSVNEKVKALFRANDPTINVNYVVVSSITARICKMWTDTYDPHIPSARDIVVHLDLDGTIKLVHAQ